MMSLFADSWATLDRAEEQAKAACLKVADATEGYKMVPDVETKKEPVGSWNGLPVHRLVVRVGNLPDYSTDTSLLLREAMMSYRSALDYMAWAAVNRVNKRLTAEQEKVVAFPMAKSRNSFWQNRNRYLPGISDELLTFAERYQPYNRTPVGRVMRSLRNLSNEADHRTLTPVFMHTVKWKGHVEIEGGKIINGKVPVQTKRPQPLKLKTLICQIDAVLGPGGINVKMDTQLVVMPGLPGVTDAIMPVHFDRISAMCTEIISEFESRV